ncbi:MAG: phosphoglycerate dehydrogenase [Clostridia bacterium]|nr:phosphoglycerate dehydrogenase [Clostridia bacterium]
MRILVTPTSFLAPVNAAAKEKIEAFADEVIYNDTGKPLQGQQLIDALQGVDGMIAGLDYLTAEVIARAPDSLKVISRYGAGTDRVDIRACGERGIKVTNTPGTNAVAVAELALALMLSVARNIPQLHEAVLRGEWPRSEGMELNDKTLGIIGLGAVGKNLAVRAVAFGMAVWAHDPCFDGAFSKRHGIARKSLEETLCGCDVVSLHVPLNDETRNLVDARRIAAMKDGAILVNTSRGGLIDENAAAEAVISGKLGGLGLDAFEQEPLLHSPLKGLPRVVFTPHTGAHTAEAVKGMGEMAVQNCMDVLNGKSCPYERNTAAGK